MPVPKDPSAFTDALADILRLPDETLAMSYIYLHKYRRFLRTSPTPDPLDPYTLALATLSLASKATESPRRLRAILLPAHRLLHPQPKTQLHPQPNPPLAIPSEAYDTLRATLVQAELILLRVLGFELRVASPMDFLGRYVARAMERVEAEEDYEGWGREERMEDGVEDGGWRTTRVGRGVWGCGLRAEAVRVPGVDKRWLAGSSMEDWAAKLFQAGWRGVGSVGESRSRSSSLLFEAQETSTDSWWNSDRCKNYNLSNLFPARVVALGCVYHALRDHGLGITEDLPPWIDRISSGKVDLEDFQEVIDELQKVSIH